MPNLVWSECGKVERTLAEWGSQEGLENHLVITIE